MSWWTLIVLLLGGLAIFLHGMTVMTDGLKSVAGVRMKSFLHSMTRNRWTSLLAGTGITAVIQSSSVTTVLAVGFVSAGLLSFQSTLGLILGANLGTTITAQIIAFKITKAAWIMAAFGYLFSVVFAKKSYKDIGTIILGLGLVFLGMNVMSEATTPLKTYQPFMELMKGLDNYFLGILIGTIFTAAVQSSSATTGIIIILASQNLISVEAGIALVFGANIGTCITAILSALGKPRDAMRVAFSHVLFNVAGVVIWFAFIDQLAALTNLISAGDHARQIANAHTLFNVANTLIFIGLVGPVARFVLWLLPKKTKQQKELFPELHSYYLENSSMALDLSNNAITKLGNYTLDILKRGLEIALNGTQAELSQLRKKDKRIDAGHAEILIFIQKIQGSKLTEKESQILEKQIEAVNILETTADLITTDLVEAAQHRIENSFIASDETINKLSDLHNDVIDAFSTAIHIFAGENATNNALTKAEFKEKLHAARAYLMTRLNEADEKRIAIFRFETEILEAIRRIHSLSRRLQRKAHS